MPKFSEEQRRVLLEAYSLICEADDIIKSFNEVGGLQDRLRSLGFRFPTLLGFYGINHHGDDVSFYYGDFLRFASQPATYPLPSSDWWDRKDRKSRTRILQKLGAESNWMCSYCLRHGSDKRGSDGRPWHLDHAYPRALNGDDFADNIVLACATCNLKKSARTAMEVFRRFFREAE